MLCVVRLGLYPAGYLRYRMRSATNSRDEPAIGGPLLPARLGSRLWQTMQVVTYTIRPLSAGVNGFDGPHADSAIANIAAHAPSRDCRRARAAVPALMERPKIICTRARVRGGR